MREYEEIANYSERIGRFQANAVFYKTHKPLKVIETEVRKLSYKAVNHIAKQAANQCQTSTLEGLYLMIKALKDDPDLTDGERFDLAWGEIELCLMASVKWFSTRYARNTDMDRVDIDDIRRRYNMDTAERNIGSYLKESHFID